MRDPTNDTKTQFLKDEAAKIGKADNLSFGAGDLSKSGSYDEAFCGCWGILHSAAVVQLGAVKDPYEAVVKPAVEGTKIVIDSIKTNSNTIQRFVNIASIASVVSADKASDTHVFKDDDWNTWSTAENGDAYGYAKTEAEKVVFADEDLKQSVATIVSVNPSVVLGPCFTRKQAEGGSASIVTGCLVGSVSADFKMNYVDVRDVAKGVTLAFTRDEETVAGQRFILNATESTSLKELGVIIQKAYPSAKGYNQMGLAAITFAVKAVVWLGTKFPVLEKIGYKEAFSFIEIIVKLDNTKSKTVLGIGEYRTIEETCKDSAESIAELIGVEDK